MNKKVTPQKRNKALLRQIELGTVKEPRDTYAIMPIGDKVDEWWVMIKERPGNILSGYPEFKDAEFILKQVAPPNYPFGPPDFYFHTPTQIYELKKKVCLDIGSYHKGNYMAKLGMLGFADAIVATLCSYDQLGGGIAIIRSSLVQRTEASKKSQDYNKKHFPEIREALLKQFEDRENETTTNLSHDVENMKLKDAES